MSSLLRATDGWVRFTLGLRPSFSRVFLFKEPSIVTSPDPPWLTLRSATDVLNSESYINLTQLSVFTVLIMSWGHREHSFTLPHVIREWNERGNTSARTRNRWRHERFPFTQQTPHSENIRSAPKPTKLSMRVALCMCTSFINPKSKL